MEPEPDPHASAPRRVEAYLDQILAPLARHLSPVHRDELRRELREHLWQRIEAYIELGHSQEEAVTESLRQFGGAEDFLKQWRQEWMQTTLQATLREMWTATRCALLLSLPAILITCFGSPIWLMMTSSYQLSWAPEWMHYCGLSDVASNWGSFVLDFIVLPIALGAASGRFIPKYAGIGVLAALASEIAFTHWLTWSLTAPNLGYIEREFAWLVFTCSTAWLPLACTTAVLTGWWAGRSKSCHHGQEIESGRLHGA